MNRLLKGIKTYFTDWKNLLTHTLAGLLILAIALFAPVNPYLRMGFIGLVVVFNVTRMKYQQENKIFKKKMLDQTIKNFDFKKF